MMFTRAADMEGRQYVKMAIYGASGTGKTTAACSAPKPALLSLEPQGMLAIRAANPDALVAPIQDWQHLRQTVSELGKLGADLPFETLVLDSATEAAEMAVQHVGRGGKLQIQHWGDVAALLARLFADLRDLPCHVVVLALQKEDQEEVDGSERTRILYRPAVRPSSVREGFGATFNVVGRTRVARGQKDEILYQIEFAPGLSTLCKLTAGVQPIEVPDLAGIFGRIVGSRAASGPPTTTAPDPEVCPWEDFAALRASKDLDHFADERRAFLSGLTPATWRKVPPVKRQTAMALLDRAPTAKASEALAPVPFEVFDAARLECSPDKIGDEKAREVALGADAETWAAESPTMQAAVMAAIKGAT